MYILIMNPEWGEKILKGEKTWEVRRSATNHIERIKIAYSKTKKSFGEVNLVKCIPLTKELFEKNVDKHCIHDSWEQVTARYPNPVAWVMEKPQMYKTPVPYTPHQGAVVWVKED